MMLAVADLAFHQRLGRLIEQSDTAGFWPTLAGFLSESIQFDTWVAMLFRPQQSPLVLADKAVNYADIDLFADYQRGLYLLDPFYAFSLGSISPGLYRLDEVAPDHFRETEYFRRYFSLNVVEDEVQFLQPLSGSGVLSLSLGSRRRFTQEEVGSLLLFAPWLLPLMSKAVQAGMALGQTPVENREEDRQERIKELLRRRGQPHLTDREVEVALLILAGHSTKGVARQLGISQETAKVHRRNMYAKLSVTTQAGLFLLMLEQEQTEPARARTS
jgi:DNA-binding CsgD family transcriptional regulator